MNACLFLVTVLAIVNHGQAQDDIDAEPPLDFDCNITPAAEQLEVPDVLRSQITGTDTDVLGYDANIELNIVTMIDNIGSSRFISETYNIADQSGRLELRTDVKSQGSEKVTYFLPTDKPKQAFVVKNFACQSKTEEKVYEAYDYTEWLPAAMRNNSEWNSESLDNILGPSAILKMGSDNNDKLKYVGQIALRGYSKVNVWKVIAFK